MIVTKYRKKTYTKGQIIDISFQSYNRNAFYNLFFKEKPGTLLIFSKLQNNSRSYNSQVISVSAFTYDVDNSSISIEEVKEFLDRFGYSYILVSSKSHRIEKRKKIIDKGIEKECIEPVRDRFHIIFPFRKDIYIKNEDDHYKIQKLYDITKEALEMGNIRVDKMVSYKKGKQGIFVSTSNNPNKYLRMKVFNEYVDDVIDSIEVENNEKEKIKENIEEDIEREKIILPDKVFDDIEQKLNALKDLYKRKGVYYDKEEIEDILGTNDKDKINFYKAMNLPSKRIYNSDKVIRLKYIPTLVVDMLLKNEELKKKINKFKKESRPMDAFFKYLLHNKNTYSIKDPLRPLIEDREDKTPSATLYVAYNRLTKKDYIIIYSHKYGIILEIDHIWIGKIQHSNLFIIDFVQRYKNFDTYIIDKKYRGYNITETKLKKKQLGGKNVLRTLYNIYGENILDEDYIYNRIKYIFNICNKISNPYKMKAYSIKNTKTKGIIKKNITKRVRKGMKHNLISQYPLHRAAEYVIKRTNKEMAKDFKKRPNTVKRLKKYYYTLYVLGFYSVPNKDLQVIKYKYVVNFIITPKLGRLFQKYNYMRKLNENRILQYYLKRYREDTYNLAKEMLYILLYINLFRINSINIKLFNNLNLFIHSRRNAYIHYVNPRLNYEIYSWYPSINNLKKVRYAIIKMLSIFLLYKALKEIIKYIIDFYIKILLFFKEIYHNLNMTSVGGVLNTIYPTPLFGEDFLYIKKLKNIINLSYYKIYKK